MFDLLNELKQNNIKNHVKLTTNVYSDIPSSRVLYDVFQPFVCHGRQNYSHKVRSDIMDDVATMR